MPIDLRNPSAVRTLTNPEADRLDTHHPPSHVCITCEGRRTFKWWDNPNTHDAVHDYACLCTEQRILYRYMLHSGVGLKYQRLCWGDMHWAEPEACEFVWQYVERMPAYLRAGRGVILRGDKGTGKTAFAVLLLKAALRIGVDGYFTTFNDMREVFFSSWRDNDEKRWFHRRVKNAGLLVLDDAGKEIENTGSSSAMDEVIRHRVADCKPTIVTSNLDREGLAIRYGEYVADLLIEQGDAFDIKQSSSRPNAASRVNEEMDLGLTRPVVLL